MYLFHFCLTLYTNINKKLSYFLSTLVYLFLIFKENVLKFCFSFYHFCHNFFPSFVYIDLIKLCLVLFYVLKCVCMFII